ncbi:hypothetical protein THASP1DRAFT_30888 [Thamnocephalis sphaerospora]|uniref:Uncharacterized protein n=1 Tax=Thamnocephalis sphaerospora TaxID=78915 RepID=A0A4P9XMW5_9FUNG|nr:hypothetical protein THASP1DRAFT_30888 [Thamnocephalis sphaerospora]|eukprot:RKP07287.1 hypothetical protein THASP1DRAFT_30888 [Thamnocephalis sphaerospora]
MFEENGHILEEGWEKNATYLLGIPLHPQGELNSLDFIMQAQGDLEEMRLRRHNLITQTVLNVLLGYIFLYNTVVSMKIVIRRRRILAGWCCLLQAISGLAFVACSIGADLPNGPSCRQVLWTAGFGMAFSPICVGVTLLQKAYLVHNRSKWLLTAGIVLLAPQPLITYYAWKSPALMVNTGGCLVIYPSELPWIKLALDAPINITFSVAFILVVYRQYRLFGSAAWARLVRDGIRTMCLIVFSNLICMLCIVFEAAGLFSEAFFLIDWVVTSALLTHHLSARRSTQNLPHRPRTSHVLHGSLQAAAAPSESLNKSVSEDSQLVRYAHVQVSIG